MISDATSTQPAFDTGAQSMPQGWLPGKAIFSDQEAMNALNPLQYVPIVGMIYRQATGEQLPPPLSIAGSIVTSAAFGGPIGILGSVALNTVMELVRLGPDQSRPPLPEGMAQGSERPMTPVSPGDPQPPGAYTTLATTLPDFLGGTPTMVAADGTPAHQVAAYYAAGDMIGAG